VFFPVNSEGLVVPTLPGFAEDGFLPPGDYELTLEELRNSHLVVGSIGSTHWDERWRAELVENLATLVRQLWAVGITEIFADGSFVSDKYHPGDIDGYFVCSLRKYSKGELQRELNCLDPYSCWTWDPRTRRPGGGKLQLPMWHRYHVELWPHYGQLSGIKDKFGNELEFPAAFRRSKGDHKPRGIIKIVKERRVT
jgi:hypothetical protein